MYLMKNTLKIIALIATLTYSAFADTNSPLSASVEVGYGSTYVVNGLAKTKEAPFAGFSIGKNYRGIDFGIGGDLLPTKTGLDESHWKVTAGKSFDASIAVLKVELEADRHQTGAVGVANSTETAINFEVQTKVITPYIRGSYDLDLDQYGYIVGAKRSFSVFSLFNLIPAVEYGQFKNYDTFAAKLGFSKVVFGHLELFAEGAYRNNNFDNHCLNLAALEFKKDFVGSGGLRWRF